MRCRRGPGAARAARGPPVGVLEVEDGTSEEICRPLVAERAHGDVVDVDDPAVPVNEDQVGDAVDQQEEAGLDEEPRIFGLSALLCLPFDQDLRAALGFNQLLLDQYLFGDIANRDHDPSRRGSGVSQTRQAEPADAKASIRAQEPGFAAGRHSSATCELDGRQKLPLLGLGGERPQVGAEQRLRVRCEKMACGDVGCDDDARCLEYQGGQRGRAKGVRPQSDPRARPAVREMIHAPTNGRIRTRVRAHSARRITMTYRGIDRGGARFAPARKEDVCARLRRRSSCSRDSWTRRHSDCEHG